MSQVTSHVSRPRELNDVLLFLREPPSQACLKLTVDNKLLLGENELIMAVLAGFVNLTQS